MAADPRRWTEGALELCQMGRADCRPTRRRSVQHLVAPYRFVISWATEHNIGGDSAAPIIFWYKFVGVIPAHVPLSPP